MRSEQSHTIEDASGYRGHADRLFAPADETELCGILREANSNGTPVTVSGAGTGVAGGRVPHGGWSISLERFSRLDIQAGVAVAGAGVLLRDVQSAVARTGQFYAPDPTENSASIGGTIATNASGSRSFRFGDTRRHVLALRVALMDASLLGLQRGQPVPFPFDPVAARETTKNTAGYYLRPDMDYLDLFIGSEGTLGIVTEAKLRLLPAASELLSGVVFLPSDECAIRAVEEWRAAPGLRMLEYMDAGSLDLLRTRYTGVPRHARAALMIEAEAAGGGDLADEWLERLEAVDAFEESWFGTEAADRERFRAFRHALPETVNDIVRRRGFQKIGTDYAVPLHRNAEMVDMYHRTLRREFDGAYVLFGHIGDAHLHANVLPESEQQAARAREVVVDLARAAAALGGTVSAEHGVGKRKAPLLHLMYTPDELAAMVAVKKKLDPQLLLGRGSVFDREPL